jgi:hypothetical protein
MESQLNKSRETIRRYDAATDQAIQIIRPLLSSRLQKMCSPVLRSCSHHVHRSGSCTLSSKERAPGITQR